MKNYSHPSSARHSGFDLQTRFLSAATLLGLSLALAFSLNAQTAPNAAAAPLSLETRKQDFHPITLRKAFHTGGKLQIGQEQFENGIGAHAVSELVLHSPSGIKKFTAKIGIDNNSNTEGYRGSVVFVVEADGKELYRSPLCKGGDAPIPVEISAPKAKALVLRVLDGGDGKNHDQADWADAKIETVDGNVSWLDQLPLLP